MNSTNSTASGGKRSWLYCGCAGAAVVAANLGVALAQDDAIIVTAQKRAQNLIDVPVSVAVTQGDDLESLNLTNATDIILLTPGLTFADGTSPRAAGFIVRGIGTNVTADGIEPSVGLTLDGVPLARTGQGILDLIDVERVETLRGPQGLLYGRNASAGLISIVSKRPTNEWTLSANASYGTDNEVRTGATVSGPIAGDRLLGRLTGYLNRRDGFIENITTGEELNNKNQYGLRAQLLFELADNAEVVIRGDWAQRYENCCTITPRQLASPATDPRPGVNFISNFIGPVEVGPKARQSSADGNYDNEVENYGVSSEINIDFGGFTLTSLSAFRGYTQADAGDADITPLNVVNVNAGGNDLKQFSQEIRLNSPQDRSVRFVLGGLFFRAENDGMLTQAGRVTYQAALAQQLGIPIPLGGGLFLPPSVNFGRSISTDIDVRDFAAFGQAEVDVTDRLSLILGGRLTDTKVSIDYARTPIAESLGFNVLLGAEFLPFSFAGDTSDTDFSWKAGLQYDLTDAARAYFTYSRGYKGPGFNSLPDLVVLPPADPVAASRVAPEIPRSYEAGIKGRFFGGAATASLTGFFTKVEDFQAQVVDRIGLLPVNVIANAGELETKGFEFEVLARPADGLSIGFNVAYVDATFKDFANAPCPPSGDLVTEVGAPCGPVAVGGPNADTFDAAGQKLANAPAWTFSANGRYERDLLPARGVRGYLQTNVYYRSAVNFAVVPDNIRNLTRHEGYAIVNLSTGLLFDDGRYGISFFARNLFDQNYVTSIFEVSAAFDGVGGLGQVVTPEAGRTIGVKLDFDF